MNIFTSSDTLSILTIWVNQKRIYKWSNNRLHRFKTTQSIIKPEKEETQTLKYKEKTEDWFEQ
jgi:hypothetical protein